MKEIDGTQLRVIQLDILMDIDRFCRENNIRYSLCGGTLLGAVRHKGYIPWDDDIDIMMPRPDYERFKSIYQSERNYIVDFSRERSYRETFIKISRKGTLMVDDLLGRGTFGINIDLFPIDGVPELNPKAYVDEIVNMKEKVAKYCSFYQQVPTKKLWWFIKFLIKRLIDFQFKSTINIKREFDLKLKSSPFESSPLAGVISGSYGYKEVIDKEAFLQYEDMAFEGYSLKGLVRFDEYLSSIYGDYMVLPPKSKQCPPHHYKSYII